MHLRSPVDILVTFGRRTSFVSSQNSWKADVWRQAKLAGLSRRQPSSRQNPQVHQNPRKVLGEICITGVLHVEVDVTGIAEDTLEYFALKLAETLCIHSAHWHRL